MNIKGTAILKSGQYRGMWKLGKHQGKYEALVQAKPCKVFRDADRDSSFDYDRGTIDSGLFGINFHKAGKDSSQVDKWSAGCQVCPHQPTYEIAMQILKASAEEWGNGFTYTLLEEKDL